MSLQLHINEDMRASVLNWLIKVYILKFHRNIYIPFTHIFALYTYIFHLQVHWSFEELRDETLYLAVNILDRFLAKRAIPHFKFNLVGIAALLVAWKYEEDTIDPNVNDLRLISGLACPYDHILKMVLITIMLAFFYLDRYKFPY